MPARNAIVFLVLFLTSTLARSQCESLSCSTLTMGMNCVGMVKPLTSPTNCLAPSVTIGTSVFAFGTQSATCVGTGTMSFMASHKSTTGALMGTMANCSFRFRKMCSFVLGGLMNTLSGPVCQVTSANGLPVELLDFSVED